MKRQHSMAQYSKFAAMALAMILVSQVPTSAFGKTKDTTPPRAILTPGVVVDGVGMNSVRTGKAFSIYYAVKDDSNLAKVTFTLYSNGSRIRTVETAGFIAARGIPALWKMNAMAVPKKGPDGLGPYYVCIGAQDGAGNRSLNFPQSTCSWLAIEVPVALVSNGCGGTQWGATFAKVQTWFLDEWTYGGVKVKFKEACDVHDAGYAGVAIWDPVLNMVMDYRPWSRKMVDDEFRQNLEYLCDLYLKGKVSATTYKICDPGTTLAKAVQSLLNPDAPAVDSMPGAQTYYDAVRAYAKAAFDTDPTKAGPQTNNMPGTYPVGGGRNNL